MIKTELLNDGTLIKHYSDEGYMLRQVETGAIYFDPIDIYPCPYTYEETEEKDENQTEISDEEFFDMLEEVL